MLSADDQQLENDSTPPRRILPKWPFFLGDVLLVTAALAVWFSSDGLSTAQLLFCLGLVGLGAIVFVAPFALEHIPAVSEFFFGPNASPPGAAAPLPTIEEEWRQQARTAAEAVEHAARANAALESSARRFDSRFMPLVEVHQNLTAAVAELREATVARATTSAGESLAIQREFERLRKDQAEKFKATEEKIAKLGEAIAVLAGQLKPPSSRPVSSVKPSVASAEVGDPGVAPVQKPSAVRVEEPVLVGAGVAATDALLAAASAVPLPVAIADETLVQPAPEISTPEKVAAPSLGSVSIAADAVGQPSVIEPETIEEKSMLARALARAQSSGQTPAVAGIIMARARRPRKSKFPMPVVIAAPEIESGPAAIAASESPASAASPVEQEGWRSLTEGKIDIEAPSEAISAESVLDPAASAPVVAPATAEIERPSTGDTSSAFRRSARAKAISLREQEGEATQKEPSVAVAPDRPEDSSDQLSIGLTQGELLAREAETIRKRRSSRSPVPACALTVRVLIGIGNKPFVRGTGPGLSLEKGVPMEFVEIGQWRWVAPGAVKEPITLRILKNDEVPAEGDAIVLHPGQSLEASPVFPN